MAMMIVMQKPKAKNKYKSIIEVIYFACNGLFYF